MRIRRRPQHSQQQASSVSDPATVASLPSHTPHNTARNRGRLEGDNDEEAASRRPDLVGEQKSGVARRLALPQDNAVASGVSTGAGAGAGAGDGHERCSSTVGNSHHNWRDQKLEISTCTNAVGSKTETRPASNGALLPATPLAVVAVKGDQEKVSSSNGSVGGGAGASKKRRGPAVLLEGSRCSRVNGRGWRCSQPTLVGYSLCEHHLGKGRARSNGTDGGGARGGPGQLGRTEHRAKVLPASSAAAAATGAAVAPTSRDGPACTAASASARAGDVNSRQVLWDLNAYRRRHAGVGTLKKRVDRCS